MGFTVTGAGETKDAAFVDYARVLRQQGKPLSDVPRVPDPENPNRRWVHVWNTQEEAKKFIDELIEETVGTDWRVELTNATPSNGPFGPIVLQLSRRGDGLVLVLDLLSRAMIRDTFPNATPGATHVFISIEAWNDFRKMRGNVKAWVEGIIPSLTGLSLDQLTDLGYAVIDADTNQTWVHVPPAGIAENHA